MEKFKRFFAIAIAISMINIFITPAIFWPLIGNQLTDDVSIPLLMQVLVVAEVVCLFLLFVYVYLYKKNGK